MTPHRATDNIQQKAGQFADRTINEWSMRPFTKEERGFCRPIFNTFQNELCVQFTDPDIFSKIENWKRGRTVIIENDNLKKD